MLKQSIKRDSERKKVSYFIFGLIFIVLLVLSFFPDTFAPFSPSESNYNQLLQKPSKLNLFGTDELGRDILSRIIFGTRVSLSVAIFTSVISLVFGTIYGLFSGIKGGIIDEILMKIVDIFYSIPDLLLISIFILLFGRGTTGIILALSLLSWMRIARITRANVIELKNRPFILSAKVMGFSDARIVFKEILPNILAPIVVTFSFTIPSSILAESTLSFLGLGISPPEVSWGLMANNGWQGIRSFPHLIVFPCLAIFISTITFIKIGEFMKEKTE
ncbi:ABC transporter permease [bacterium]|nr:ABC transporter permease [bacterium]